MSSTGSKTAPRTISLPGFPYLPASKEKLRKGVQSHPAGKQVGDPHTSRSINPGHQCHEPMNCHLPVTAGLLEPFLAAS